MEGERGADGGCCRLPPGPLPGAVHMVFPGSHTAPSNTSSAFPMAGIRSPYGWPPPPAGVPAHWEARLGVPILPSWGGPAFESPGIGEGSESVPRRHTSTQVLTSKS